MEYDPGLAAFCREVFGDTVLKYTKPATRLKGHMAGYDPSKAPKFVWPERAEKARKAAIQAAQARSKAAEEKKIERDSSQDSSQLKPLTIDAIFTSDELNEKGLGQFAWRPNHPGYYRLASSKNGKGQDVVYEDIETKQSTILVTAEQLTPEGEKLLFPSQVSPGRTTKRSSYSSPILAVFGVITLEATTGFTTSRRSRFDSSAARVKNPRP